MGGHYGSIHVRTEDAKPVELAVTKIAREREVRFLIAPSINGWVTVFPEGNGQDSAIGGLLAELVGSELIQCQVHDDEIFGYWYYKNGSLKDRYNSHPTYFDPSSTEPRGGDAKTLEHLLTGGATGSELNRFWTRRRAIRENLIGWMNSGSCSDFPTSAA